MKPKLLHLGLSLLAGVSFMAVTAALGQDDDASFEQYGQTFKGKIGRSFGDSVEWYPETTKPKPGTPNVLIVLLDDVGYSQVGSYGGWIQTPNIDALAADGLPPWAAT